MSDDSAEKRFLELEDLARQYAEAQAEASYLEEFRKSKKAALMKQAELDGKSSAVIQEREAYAHQEYQAFLEGLKEATERALFLKWKLTLVQMRFESWRTLAANKRAEMNLR